MTAAAAGDTVAASLWWPLLCATAREGHVISTVDDLLANGATSPKMRRNRTRDIHIILNHAGTDSAVWDALLDPDNGEQHLANHRNIPQHVIDHYVALFNTPTGRHNPAVSRVMAVLPHSDIAHFDGLGWQDAESVLANPAIGPALPTTPTGAVSYETLIGIIWNNLSTVPLTSSAHNYIIALLGNPAASPALLDEAATLLTQDLFGPEQHVDGWERLQHNPNCPQKWLHYIAGTAAHRALVDNFNISETTAELVVQHNSVAYANPCLSADTVNAAYNNLTDRTLTVLLNEQLTTTQLQQIIDDDTYDIAAARYAVLNNRWTSEQLWDIVGDMYDNGRYQRNSTDPRRDTRIRETAFEHLLLRQVWEAWKHVPVNDIHDIRADIGDISIFDVDDTVPAAAPDLTTRSFRCLLTLGAGWHGTVGELVDAAETLGETTLHP